jgi:hypothetical protein
MKRLITCGVVIALYGCTPPKYHSYQDPHDYHRHHKHDHEHEEKPTDKMTDEEKKEKERQEKEDREVDGQVDDLVNGGLGILEILKFANWWRISP